MPTWKASRHRVAIGLKTLVEGSKQRLRGDHALMKTAHAGVIARCTSRIAQHQGYCRVDWGPPLGRGCVSRRRRATTNARACSAGSARAALYGKYAITIARSRILPRGRCGATTDHNGPEDAGCQPRSNWYSAQPRAEDSVVHRRDHTSHEGCHRMEQTPATEQTNFARATTHPTACRASSRAWDRADGIFGLRALVRTLHCRGGMRAARVATDCGHWRKGEDGVCNV